MYVKYMYYITCIRTHTRKEQWDTSSLDLIISNDYNIIFEIAYEALLHISDHACHRFNINYFRTEQAQNRKFHMNDKVGSLNMPSEQNKYDE